MEIKTLDALIEFVKECKSVEAIEQVIKSTLKVNYVMVEDTPIEEVKEATLSFIGSFKDKREIPLFITNLNKHWKFIPN